MSATDLVAPRRELRLRLTCRAGTAVPTASASVSPGSASASVVTAAEPAWASAVRSARGLCLVVDARGRLVAASAPALAALGPGATPGQRISQFWSEDVPALGGAGEPERESLLRRSASAGQPVHSFVRLMTPSGELPAEVVVIPLGPPPSPLLVFAWERRPGPPPVPR